jgi:hypothetical protein
MKTYDTLVEAVQDLKKRGFNEDFTLQNDSIVCNHIKFAPEDFEVVEVYRFEGMSNPDDSSVLYAIEGRNGMKGVLIDAYGAYAGGLNREMILKLQYTPGE